MRVGGLVVLLVLVQDFCAGGVAQGVAIEGGGLVLSFCFRTMCLHFACMLCPKLRALLSKSHQTI